MPHYLNPTHHDKNPESTAPQDHIILGTRLQLLKALLRPPAPDEHQPMLLLHLQVHLCAIPHCHLPSFPGAALPTHLVTCTDTHKKPVPLLHSSPGPPQGPILSNFVLCGTAQPRPRHSPPGTCQNKPGTACPPSVCPTNMGLEQPTPSGCPRWAYPTCRPENAQDKCLLAREQHPWRSTPWRWTHAEG